MKIVIAGNYGADNLGDDLILEGLLRTAREITTKAELTVLSAKPKQTAEKFNVHSAHKFPAGIRSLIKYFLNGEFKKTKKIVKECDYFILGGGGLFDETYKKSIFIWSIQAWFAYHYKKPVIMYGQSLNPLHSKYAKNKVKKLFRKADFIAMRDETSKSELKKLIKGKKIHVVPDLIFRIPNPTQENQDRKAQLLICLRTLKEPTPKLEEGLTGFLNQVHKNTSLETKFVPFKKNKDESLNKKILNELDEKEKAEILKFTSDTTSIKKLFAASKIVVGIRLHSILMAITTGTPFIAINYNPKVRNMLTSLGLEEFCLDVDEVTSTKLYEMLGKLRNREIWDATSQKLQRISEEQSKNMNL